MNNKEFDALAARVFASDPPRMPELGTAPDTQILRLDLNELDQLTAAGAVRKPAKDWKKERTQTEE